MFMGTQLVITNKYEIFFFEIDVLWQFNDKVIIIALPGSFSQLSFNTSLKQKVIRRHKATE